MGKADDKIRTIRTIGVLTSGGDAPGMNAAIRGVVRFACANGYEVMGIRRGYHGFLLGEISPLGSRDVSEKLQRGGTFLQTARSESFYTDEGVQRAVDMARTFRIDVLVVIGGDGTLRGAAEMAKKGLPVIAIPATIDNDIQCTDYTIGYDTAMNTAMEAIDKLKDTASSHERCSTIEVMGRKAGYLALNVGISCGAEVVLIPEIPFDVDQDLIKPLLIAKNRGKRHYVVVIAEGVGDTMKLTEYITDRTGIEARATILGHLQRGGSPSTRDRQMAGNMAIQAVECIIENRFNRVIAYRKGQILDKDIFEALKETKTISKDDFDKAMRLSI